MKEPVWRSQCGGSPCPMAINRSRRRSARACPSRQGGAGRASAAHPSRITRTSVVSLGSSLLPGGCENTAFWVTRQSPACEKMRKRVSGGRMRGRVRGGRAKGG